MRARNLAALAAVGTISFGATAFALDGTTDVRYAGSYRIAPDGSVSTFDPATMVSATETFSTIYSNLFVPTTRPPNAAFARADTEVPVFGDTITTVGTGRLQEFTLSLFNPGGTPASAGPMLTGSVTVTFHNNSTPYPGSGPLPPVIGSFTRTVNLASLFGPGGLAVGFFAQFSLTGLNPENINLPTTSLLITQRWTNLTGGANRNGFASVATPTIGTSAANFYWSGFGANPAGLYTLNPAGTLTNAIYAIVIPEPATLGVLAGAAMLVLRRR